MKKKTHLLLVLFFISAFSFAGDTVAVRGFKRVYFGVSFTPGVGYRLLSHNYYPPDDNPPNGFTEQQVQKMILDERAKYEKPTFAYNVGLKFGINATRFLAIETGLEYSSRAYTTRRDHLMFSDGFLPDLTYDSTKYGSLVATTGYHYLDIPVALHFSIGKKKVKAIINTGANFDLMMGQWSHVFWESSTEGHHTSNKSTSNTGQFKSFNLSPFLGVGIDYHINHYMVLRVMPTAQMQALKNIDTPITEHLWSAGVNMCLLFGFVEIK